MYYFLEFHEMAQQQLEPPTGGLSGGLHLGSSQMRREPDLLVTLQTLASAVLPFHRAARLLPAKRLLGVGSLVR